MRRREGEWAHFKSVCTYVPGDGAINIRHYNLVSVVPEIQRALRLSGTLHRLPEWYGQHKDNITTEDVGRNLGT